MTTNNRNRNRSVAAAINAAQLFSVTEDEDALTSRQLGLMQNIAAAELLRSVDLDDRERTLPAELPGCSRGPDGELIDADMGHPWGAPQKFESYVPIAVDGPVAARLLEHNKCNRDPSAVNINRLANVMLSGDWKFNGQSSTLICSNCEVLNSQHTLHAIVQANETANAQGLKFKPVVMIPIIGLPQDTFGTIDGGRPRGTKDTLTASAKTENISLGDVPASEYATALRIMLQYVNLVQDIQPNSPFYLNGLREKIPNHRAAELLKRFPELSESMEFCNTLPAFHVRGPVVKLHVAAVLHSIISAVQSQTAANSFIRALMTGANLEEDSPIYRLREQLRNDQARQIRAEGIDRLAVCVRAWNMFATHKAPPAKGRIRGMTNQSGELVFPAPVPMQRRPREMTRG